MAVRLQSVFVAVLVSIVWTKTTARQAPILIPITTEPPDGYFYTGDKLTLTCVATGTPTPRYTWMYNGAIKSNNQTSGVLTTTSATSADAGRYECQATNQYGTAMSETVVMQLAFIGEFSDRTTAPNLNVAPRVLASMPCRGKPSSAPQATYGWAQFVHISDSSTAGTVVTYDERRQVDQSTGTLYFANVNVSDRHASNNFYGCLAGITTTTKVGSYVNLTVTGSTGGNTIPTNAFRYPTTDSVNIILGQEATFKCFFYGYPTPAVTWQKNGQAVGSDSLDEFNTLFTINPVQESDNGDTIRCTGTNSRGSSSYSWTIYVVVKPTFDSNDTSNLPKDLNVTVGDTANFVCNPRAEPPLDTILWYRNGVQLDVNNLPARYHLSADLTNLTISDVNFNDFMIVACKASNAYGDVMKQGSLTVLEATSVTSSPTNQSVANGQSAVFSCSATSDPTTPVTFSWLFDGNEIEYKPNDIYAECSATSCDLKIDSVRDEYGGFYTCIATNTYSYSNGEDAYLEVLPPIYVFSAATIWWVWLIIGLLFLILIIVVVCYCYCKDNDGDSYPVDDIEKKNGNDPDKELKDTGFLSFEPPREPNQVWTVGYGVGGGPGSKFSDSGSTGQPRGVGYRADPDPSASFAPPGYGAKNAGYSVGPEDSSSTLQRGMQPLNAGYGPVVPPVRSRPVTPRSAAGGLEYAVAQPRSPQQQQQQQPWMNEEPERDVVIRPTQLPFSSFQPPPPPAAQLDSRYDDDYYDDEDFDDGGQRGGLPIRVAPVGGLDPRNPYAPGPYGRPVVADDEVFAGGRVMSPHSAGGPPYQYQYDRPASESSV